MTKLLERDLIHGRVLDFGCGKGRDVEYLEEKAFSCSGWDPNSFHLVRPKSKFDTVLCTYVLNTLPKKYFRDIMQEIVGYLEHDGVAYVTVRADVKNDGLTSKRTYQRDVKEDEFLGFGMELIFSNSWYRIWRYCEK